MNSVTREMFDSVRAVLMGRPLDDDQRRELALRVSETSAAFRRRVDRAVRYSRQGLRLEAAAEAEAEPSVFELAELLDNDDLQKWRALCTRNHLPVPETPDPTALGEVEEAISQLRPLRKLLERMRRLVLSDAPLWDRLQVLRQLTARDRDNPAWHDDLAALEPVAAAALAEQCERALRHADLDAAVHCIEHLEDGQWHAVNTARMAEQLRAEYDAAVVTDCAQRAQAVLAALEIEWAAENLAGVRVQLTEWRTMEARAAAHNGALHDDLLSRAAAVEEWYEARQLEAGALREHSDRAAALDRLLASERGALRDIRAALSACEETTEGCPEDLRRQALAQIEARERAQNLKRAMVAGAAIVGIAALVAAVWYGVKTTELSNRVDAAAAAIQGNVDAGRLDEAERQLAEAEQDAQMAGDSRLAAARSAYAAARDAVSNDDREFGTLMAAAGDPESPDAREQDVERAGKLARNDEQRTQVREWTRQHKRAVDARAAARVQALSQQMADVLNALGALHVDAPDAAERLRDLDAQVEALARNAGETATLRDSLERARTLVTTHRAAMQAAIAESARKGGLRGLAAAAGDPQALQLAIEAFVAQHQGTPEALSLSDAAQAAPLWQGIASWNTALGSHPWAEAATLSQLQRDAMLAALRKFVDAHASAPFAPAAREFMPLLASADSWRTYIGDKTEQLPAFSYYVVERVDGTRAYTVQDPAKVSSQAEAGGARFKIISVITSGGADPKTAFERIELSRIKKEGPSAQVALASWIRDLLAEPEPDATMRNGPMAALAVLEKVRDSDGVDGAFAAVIARGVLEAFEPEAPAVIRPQVQAAARALAKQKPDTVEWLAGGASARERSAALRTLLRQTLKTEEWRKAYVQAVAAAAAPLAVRYVPAGILLPGAESAQGRTFASSGRAGPGAGSALWALQVGVGGNPSVLVQIGDVDSAGTATLNADADKFPVGTMVFTRNSGGSAK